VVHSFPVPHPLLAVLVLLAGEDRAVVVWGVSHTALVPELVLPASPVFRLIVSDALLPAPMLLNTSFFLANAMNDASLYLSSWQRVHELAWGVHLT
jgi:hypothetical protein